MNLSKQQIDAISNLGLAHMGDCVFEILCRSYLCAKGETTVDRLHRDTIAMVKATGLEALFGALYLAGRTERINELFKAVMEGSYGI